MKALCVTELASLVRFMSSDFTSPVAVPFVTRGHKMAGFGSPVGPQAGREKRKEENESAGRRTFQTACSSHAVYLTYLSGVCTVGKKTCHCSKTVFSNSVHPCIVINRFPKH